MYVVSVIYTAIALGDFLRKYIQHGCLQLYSLSTGQISSTIPGWISGHHPEMVSQPW